MSGVSESPAGRAEIVELETLALGEILPALPRTTLESAMVRGGYPELHAHAAIDGAAARGPRSDYLPGAALVSASLDV